MLVWIWGGSLPWSGEECLANRGPACAAQSAVDAQTIAAFAGRSLPVKMEMQGGYDELYGR